MDSPWVRLFAGLELSILDHGFLRPLFNRPYQIAPGIYRSNQPSPRQIRKLAKNQGIKTILNLRGESERGYHLLESEACEQQGIELINLKMSSRRPPRKQAIEQLKEIFDSADKPLLLHCKSGADRAGLVSALYLLMTESGTVEQARKMLTLRFFHIKSAKTGVLDAVLDDFDHWQAQGVGFMTWVREHYDPHEIANSFQPKGWANVLVDGVLRRE